ncbi:MAG: tetratricopeptide repeat protein [Spirochaetes bacterium]|nr:tetratricopeptide repeat protein [Spirochaetota bacterium]
MQTSTAHRFTKSSRRFSAVELLLLLFLVGLLAGCQSYVRRVDLAEEYFNLANAFYDLEEYERAAEYYREALSLDPDLAPATFNLARAYIEAGAYSDAIPVLEELRTRDEANVLVVESLAYAYSEQDRYEDAAGLYDEVLSESPYRLSALYSGALVHLRLEDTGRARELLERAWEAQPDDIDVLFQYGRVLHLVGEAETAVSMLSEYVDGAPAGQTDRLLSVARIYADERYFARALAVYERIIAREPDNAGALFGEAELQLTAVEDAPAGVESLTAALEAGFDDEERAAELLEQENLLSRTRVTSLLVEYGLVEPDESAGQEEDGDQDEDAARDDDGALDAGPDEGDTPDADE